jgi:hypothetical protein
VPIRWSIPAMLPIVVLATVCATTASSPTTTVPAPVGVVSGVASPCEGPTMPQAQYEAIPVRVRLIKNNREVSM